MNMRLTDMSPTGQKAWRDKVKRYLAAVEAERIRQIEKWGLQGHSSGDWALILGEEVGEAHKAALQLWLATSDEEADEATSNLRAELIQVAAVAIAWAQGLEVPA